MPANFVRVRAKFPDRRTVTIPYPLLIPILLVLACLSMLFSLTTGSVEIAPSEALSALFDAETQQGLIMHELRLPRSLGAFVTGAMLALAGSLLQVLLRNPLADPYVLGISGGASVASLAAMMLGFGTALVMGSAALGAITATLLVFVLATGAGVWSSTRLLLTGVILASGWGALISFLLAISTDQRVFGMLFWLMGDLSQSRPGIWSGLVLAVVFIFALLKSRDINLLASGELHARSLGVSVLPLQYSLFFATALLTGSAVMLAGNIGFVGLVVPHMVRLTAGDDYRGMIPAVCLLGGAMVVAADTLARSIIAPQQLPVGVITAFIGVPVFLFLLRRTLADYRD